MRRSPAGSDFPTKGRAPTGIFSTRGKQKQDGMSAPGAALHRSATKVTQSNPPKTRDNRIRK